MFWEWLTCKSVAFSFSTMSNFPVAMMSRTRSPALLTAVTEAAKTCKNGGCVDIFRQDPKLKSEWWSNLRVQLVNSIRRSLWTLWTLFTFHYQVSKPLVYISFETQQYIATLATSPELIPSDCSMFWLALKATQKLWIRWWRIVQKIVNCKPDGKFVKRIGYRHQFQSHSEDNKIT